MSKRIISQKNKLKILVALSGGVDSAVATQLLVNEGHDVSAVFLRLWQESEEESIEKKNNFENHISSDLACQDAKKIAQKIGVPFFCLDLSLEFKQKVVDYFLFEYESGRTPNPCVVCNREIKLGLLFKQALALAYDFLATGHYLRTAKNNDGSIAVFKAKDKLKDQSYFLYNLNQSQLKNLYFPLGNYTKDEVKELANKFGLITANKKESQDICFITGLHSDFLKKHLKLVLGDIKLKETGKTIGRHQGLALYTLGQRKGIDIGGDGPYYVAEKDIKNNILWVASALDISFLEKKEFIVRDLNWLSGEAPKSSRTCQVAIRYSQEAVAARVSPYEAGAVKVELVKAIRAIASGQSAVFYDKQKLLGGGVIDNSL